MVDGYTGNVVSMGDPVGFSLQDSLCTGVALRYAYILTTVRIAPPSPNELDALEN